MGRFGSLAFNMTGTYLVELITQPMPGLDIDPTTRVRDWYDCIGFYSSESRYSQPAVASPVPDAWQTPWDLDLSFTWRLLRRGHGPDRSNDQMPDGAARRGAAG